MPNEIKSIKSKDEFRALRASGKVIFVGFYTDANEACERITPTFERLAKEHAEEDVEFHKVNVEMVPDLAQELNIRPYQVPIFHAYKNNEKLDTVTQGGANIQALAAFVKTSLARAIIC